jgi:DNA repair protein RadA/Sms
VEIQALATSTPLGTPRRTVLGLDRNRVALLVAVLEKKLGLALMGHDIFMNVAGGVKIDEPAVDLAVVAAVASSFLDKPVTGQTVILGEVGLTGEVRAVGQLETRVAEAGKLGFTRCVVPTGNLRRTSAPKGMEIVGVRQVAEAMETLF